MNNIAIKSITWLVIVSFGFTTIVWTVPLDDAWRSQIRPSSVLRPLSSNVLVSREMTENIERLAKGSFSIIKNSSSGEKLAKKYNSERQKVIVSDSFYHDDVYWWIKQKVDSGIWENDYLLINFDHHSDDYNGSAGMDPGNWIGFIKRHNLVGKYCWVYTDKGLSRPHHVDFMINNLSRLPDSGKPVIVTIDMDYFIPCYKSITSEEINQKVKSVVDALVLKGYIIKGINITRSRDYINTNLEEYLFTRLIAEIGRLVQPIAVEGINKIIPEGEYEKEEKVVYKVDNRFFKFYGKYNIDKIRLYKKITDRVKELLERQPQDRISFDGVEYKVAYTANPIRRVFLNQDGKIGSESKFISGVRLNSLLENDEIGLSDSLAGMEKRKQDVFRSLLIDKANNLEFIWKSLGRRLRLIMNRVGLDSIDAVSNNEVLVQIDSDKNQVYIVLTEVCASIGHLKEALYEELKDKPSVNLYSAGADPGAIKDQTKTKPANYKVSKTKSDLWKKTLAVSLALGVFVASLACIFSNTTLLSTIIKFFIVSFFTSLMSIDIAYHTIVFILSHMYVQEDQNIESIFYTDKITDPSIVKNWPPVSFVLPVVDENWEVVKMSLLSAIDARGRYYERTGSVANVIVADDALMKWSKNDLAGTLQEIEWKKNNSVLLSQNERQINERVAFYRENQIGFSARPMHGTKFDWGIFERKGSFKKASNLNYLYNFEKRLRDFLKAGETYEKAIQKVKQEYVKASSSGEYSERSLPLFKNGYFEGDLLIHDYIMMLDKDTIVPRNALVHIVPEFVKDKSLAFAIASNYYTVNLNEILRSINSSGHHLNTPFLNLLSSSGVIQFRGTKNMVRKDILMAVEGFSEYYTVEDSALTIPIKNLPAPDTNTLYHGKLVNFPEKSIMEINGMPDDELDRYCTTFDILEKDIRKLQELPYGELKQYILKYNISSTEWSIMTQKGLTRRFFKVLLVYLEQMSNFGIVESEDVMDEVFRRRRFSFGNIQLLLNPWYQWRSKGIFTELFREMHGSPNWEWHEKFDFTYQKLISNILIILPHLLLFTLSLIDLCCKTSTLDLMAIPIFFGFLSNVGIQVRSFFGESFAILSGSNSGLTKTVMLLGAFKKMLKDSLTESFFTIQTRIIGLVYFFKRNWSEISFRPTPKQIGFHILSKWQTVKQIAKINPYGLIVSFSFVIVSLLGLILLPFSTAKLFVLIASFSIGIYSIYLPLASYIKLSARYSNVENEGSERLTRAISEFIDRSYAHKSSVFSTEIRQRIKHLNMESAVRWTAKELYDVIIKYDKFLESAQSHIQASSRKLESLELQTTIAPKDGITFIGTGWHTRKKIIMTLKPAPPGTGRVFIRKDLPGEPKVRAICKNITLGIKTTCLRENGVKVLCPEHLLAALGILGVNNTFIELDCEEVPVFDGSALYYYLLEARRDSFIRKQNIHKDMTKTLDTLVIYSKPYENGIVFTFPNHESEGITITYAIDFGEDSGIGAQSATIPINSENFWSTLAFARNFLIADQKTDELHRLGFLNGARHGVTTTFFRLDKGKNSSSLIRKDEPVLHKVVDLLGDFQLLDFDMKGIHLVAVEAGHADHANFVKKLQGYLNDGQNLPYTLQEIERAIKKIRDLFFIRKCIPPDTYRKILKVLNHYRSIELDMQKSSSAGTYFVEDEKVIDEATRIIMKKMDSIAVANDELLRIHILDNNVFYETRRSFDFLPITVSDKISGFMKKTKSLSFIIGMENTEPLDESRRNYIKKFLWCLVNGNIGRFFSVLRDNKTGIKLEIFSKDRVSLLPKKINTIIWKDIAKEKFRAKKRISFGSQQPGYHRYIGFFDKMKQSNIFTFANDLQFVKKDWQHRQQMPLGNGEKKWYTVPLHKKERIEPIAEKRIFTEGGKRYWARAHWQAFQKAYGKFPFFDRYAAFFKTLYSRKWVRLDSLDEAITRFLAKELGVHDVEILRSSDIENDPNANKARSIAEEIKKVTDGVIDKSNTKIVYISGSGADYLEWISGNGVTKEKDIILEEGIDIEVRTVSGEYMKNSSGLDPYQSAAAFLFMFGSDALAKVVGMTTIMTSEPMPDLEQSKPIDGASFKKVRLCETKILLAA